MKFVNPKNDVAFKKIFGDEQHKEILIAFLNAVLELEGVKKIQAVQILNPWQAPKLEFLKYTLLDIKATDQRGVHFIVEMQVENVAGLRKRFQYYLAKSYSSQIERGTDYPRLNQVIFIGILDFKEFNSSHYLSRHLLLNRETHEQELQDFEFNFIELPKFTKTEPELETALEKWVYFLKYASDLEVIPTHVENVPLRQAYEVANYFGWSREELEVYEYWGIKAQDERGAVQLALQQGLQQGIEIEQLEIAQRMLADGMSLEMVTKYTQLPIEVVNNLLKK